MPSLVHASFCSDNFCCMRLCIKAKWKWGNLEYFHILNWFQNKPRGNINIVYASFKDQLAFKVDMTSKAVWVVSLKQLEIQLTGFQWQVQHTRLPFHITFIWIWCYKLDSLEECRNLQIFHLFQPQGCVLAPASSCLFLPFLTSSTLLFIFR